MRMFAKFVLFAVLATAQVGFAVPEAAADGFTRVKKKIVRVHRHARVVADYDGTPIVLRRSRAMVVLPAYDGTPVLVGTLEARQVRGLAVPTRYLNGQPVRSYPRRAARIWVYRAI